MIKLRSMLVLALLLAATGASAAEFGGIRDLYVYPSLQYFTWEEFSDGKRLLKESGPLFGAGGAINVDLLKAEAGALTLRGKGELFGGVVDYDGQTQPPNPLPVKTDVVYFGFKGETAVGWAVPVRKVRIEPFAGLGYRWWLRDLQNTTINDTTGAAIQVQGYTEQWESAYTMLGAAVDYTINERWRLSWEAGGKYPFYNANRVDLVGVGKVTVKPEPRWSPFYEVGIRYNKFRFAHFYEGYRVAESPAVPISQTTAILQPRSNEDIFGVSFAWCFR